MKLKKCLVLLVILLKRGEVDFIVLKTTIFHFWSLMTYNVKMFIKTSYSTEGEVWVIGFISVTFTTLDVQ